LNEVEGNLFTATGENLTVLGQAKVRLHLGNFDGEWYVIVARGLAHGFRLLSPI